MASLTELAAIAVSPKSYNCDLATGTYLCQVQSPTVIICDHHNRLPTRKVSGEVGSKSGSHDATSLAESMQCYILWLGHLLTVGNPNWLVRDWDLMCELFSSAIQLNEFYFSGFGWNRTWLRRFRINWAEMKTAFIYFCTPFKM